MERANGRGRAARNDRRELSESRVDIATPARLDALSDSAAARIRAKVEAKLAERAHVRLQGTASPAPSKSTKSSRTRTRSGMNKGSQTRSRSAAGRSRQARSALNNTGAAGSRKVTESAGRGRK
jgi:hypothetical protein